MKLSSSFIIAALISTLGLGSAYGQGSEYYPRNEMPTVIGHTPKQSTEFSQRFGGKDKTNTNKSSLLKKADVTKSDSNSGAYGVTILDIYPTMTGTAYQTNATPIFMGENQSMFMRPLMGEPVVIDLLGQSVSDGSLRSTRMSTSKIEKLKDKELVPSFMPLESDSNSLFLIKADSAS